MITIENNRNTPFETGSPYELRLNQAEGYSEADIQNALETGEIGFLHSFTTGSVVDGPGVRVVAWTSGCQFRCIYCHNPDTWKLKNGMPVTLQRISSELIKYKAGLKSMKGGFTLSGGEPLMQDRFAVRIFESAKSMGIHTALDTNGAFGDRLGDKDLENIDLVLLDIKSWDETRHLEVTGVKREPVLDFARRLAKIKKPVWLRYVLVPGFTDNKEDIEALSTFASELGNIERVDVLPFHQLGEYKWRELKLDYKLAGTSPPPADLIKQTCDMFRAKGLKA